MEREEEGEKKGEKGKKESDAGRVIGFWADALLGRLGWVFLDCCTPRENEIKVALVP
jgi:hypothetical protein